MPNTWLEFQATYEGMGRAEFTDPAGWIEGPTKVHFNEFGDVTCEMAPTDLHSERELRCGWMEFLTGEEPRQDGTSFTIGFSGPNNPCKSLEVVTPKGMFRAQKLTVQGFNSDLVSLKELRFHPWRSEFTVRPTPGPPKFWAMPLWNYRSDFSGRRTPVDDHPLRFSPPPPPSAAEDPDQRLMENWAAASSNRVIWFPFSGGTGYIEPLPDYEERIEALQDGRAQRLITASLAGDLGLLSPNIASFERHFPVQILTLIELATGVEVGAPWIELRDEFGALCRRLHVHLGSPYFHEGQQSVSQHLSRGIGYLIAKGLESAYLREDFFMIASRNLVRAGRATIIDEGLRHLIVALESLCKRFGYNTTNLLAGLNPELQEDVRASLVDARKRLFEEWCAKPGVGARDRGILERVAQRVETTAASQDRSFGISVAKLIDHFGLPDNNVAEPFFLAHHGGRGPGFCSALSWMRGKAIHGGYFDFAGGSDDVDEIVAMSRHLHDLVLRILLKLVGYDDLYQPTVISWTAAEPLHWLKEGDPPTKLGYRTGNGAAEDT